MAVATGLVEKVSPQTHVAIDSPAGLVEAYVGWDGERVGEVEMVNVPSFIFQRDITVDTPTFGRVTADVCFGGAFYAYVENTSGVALVPSEAHTLRQFGTEVSKRTS